MIGILLESALIVYVRLVARKMLGSMSLTFAVMKRHFLVNDSFELSSIVLRTKVNRIWPVHISFTEKRIMLSSFEEL